MPRRPLSREEYLERLDAAHPNKFEVLEFRSLMQAARFRCLSCSHEFESRANNLLLRGRCSSCSPAPGHNIVDGAIAAAREHAAQAGVEMVRYEPHPKRRGGRYVFRCSQHGEYTTTRPSRRAKCPRCLGYVSPNDPKFLPARLHNKPCALYLVAIRDPQGQYLTKVGISTDWKSRKRHYARAGVQVLREIRMVQMTLLEALTIEQTLKRWMRRTLGRRRCPVKRWAGWSECAVDPFGKFPGEFDREVARHRAGR